MPTQTYEMDEGIHTPAQVEAWLAMQEMTYGTGSVPRHGHKRAYPPAPEAQVATASEPGFLERQPELFTKT